MRNNFTIICLVLSVLFSACNDWLSVEPKNQISQEKLFSDENGYRNALHGIYQACSQQSLYGMNLSWGALSTVSQQYTTNTIGSDYALVNFNTYTYGYSRTLRAIDDIWSGLYNAIANCNLLIREISDESPSLFSLDTVAKNLILGEALALRALCHMDLYRLFAPAPIKGRSEAWVPYHKEYPSDFAKTYTAAEGMGLAIEDLLQARKLVAYKDTILHRTEINSLSARMSGTSLNTEEFYVSRAYRMNYVAIVGLLARAYLYKGDMENAKLYAGEVYNNFFKTKKWFKFHAATSYTTSLANKDKKHLDDCLFSFYDENLVDVVENYHNKIGALHIQDVGAIFLNDEDDYRRYLINSDGTAFTNCIKYREVDNITKNIGEGKAIPIIRLTEIFHILMECNFDTNPDESLRLYKELRQAMGCKRNITEIGTKAELYDIIINDARREFIAEGQLFFYYKRLNKGIKIPNAELEPTEERMTFPIPDSQYI